MNDRPIIPTVTAHDRRLSLVYRPIDELKPHPGNPRRHNRAQLRKLAHNIKKLGFRAPVLCLADGTIVAGHGRVEAARLAGLTEIPTVAVDGLTPEEVRLLMLSDNRLAELATWDDQALARELEELARICPDLTVELSGFETGEIDFRIAAQQTGSHEECDPADVLPEPRPNAVSRPGDLFDLPPHKIACADARYGVSYEALMQGMRARAVFCDSPYNLESRFFSGLGVTQHPDFAMAAGEMSPAEFMAFLAEVNRAIGAHVTDGALCFQCIDWRHCADAIYAARESGWNLLNLCVWVKHNPGMGSFLRSGHELILVLKHGSAPHINNVQLGRFGRSRSNVWHYKGANDFGRGEGEGNLLALHPSPKPVAMIADAVMDCTNRGDWVLDPFLGSGSTLIAAERVGRKCFGIEIEPRYVDISIERWERITGGVARHVATGRTFRELAAERRVGQ